MKLSVIVCTHNRSHTIIGCLDSILASLSAAAPVDAEIVVIDNASTDDTYARVQEWTKNSPFPVNLQKEPRPGTSKARNCGIKHAKGDLLVWTDDDCRMDKSYVIDALRHDAADTEPVLRGGSVVLGDPVDLNLTITEHHETKRWHRKWNSARRENLGNCMLGCNMAMRRSVVEKLGLFDENLGAGTVACAGEDTDYIFRAYTAGVMLEFVPDMKVFHFHGRKTLPAGHKLFKAYMTSAGALYAKHFFKHPDLCRQFYWDCKNAVKEMIHKNNTFLPEINFSNKDRVRYALSGAVKYCWARLWD